MTVQDFGSVQVGDFVAIVYDDGTQSPVIGKVEYIARDYSTSGVLLWERAMIKDGDGEAFFLDITRIVTTGRL